MRSYITSLHSEHHDMTKATKPPMRQQPIHGSQHFPSEMQPATPKSGRRPSDIADILAEKGAKLLRVKDPAHTAKARVSRLAALRKQRDATNS
jgi:hypothetical protein